MEDIVAVELLLKGGRKRYVLTWGRVQHPVDGAALEAIVLKHASKFALGGVARKARLCRSLRDAARQPYFHEALFAMARVRTPSGRGSTAWKKNVDRRMRRGLDLYYLGR
jgi:hypothetical protein